MSPLQNDKISYFSVVMGSFLCDRLIFSHFSANEPKIIALNRAFPIKKAQYPYVCPINRRSAKSFGSLFKLYA
ncbi:MAG: hypothetical protein ACWA6R_12155, partial [Nitrosomonas sp.]